MEPVVVVGAGPVGMTAALLLARYEVPTVILEARTEPTVAGSRSICLQRDVLDVLDHIGVARPLADEGVTWWTGRTYYREHEVLLITFAEAGRPAWPPFINIPQTTVEARLRERVLAEPLVTVRMGHRVVDLRPDADGVTLRVEPADGDPEPVRASYVLGCDGVRSTVRDRIGETFEGESYDDKFLICDVRADLGFASERRFFFNPPWNPGRQVLVHPQPHGVWRIDWQVPPEFDLATERSGGLDARIRQITGDAPYELVWSSQYTFDQRCAGSLYRDRVFLLGDAAHAMTPFGARGLNSGIQDAENAAWKLAYVRHGWASTELLTSYDAERRAAALENLRVTGATMRFLVPQTDAELEHRTTVLERSVTDPRARRQIDSGRLAEPYWYVESPLTTPDPKRSPAWTPPERGQSPVVAPGVLLPDAPVEVPGQPSATRLRELLGRGLLVLVGDDRDTAALRELLADPTGAPALVVRLSEVDTDGVLAQTLCAGAGEAWLVRPDGHVAAVARSSAELWAVVRTVLAMRRPA